MTRNEKPKYIYIYRKNTQFLAYLGIISLAAVLLLTPLASAQYFTNFVEAQVNVTNIFGYVVASAWLGWQFTVNGQQIVSWNLGPYGAASYYFLDSASAGNPTASGSPTSLIASLPVTFSNPSQTIKGTLYNDIYYYPDGNYIVVYYGFNGNMGYGNSASFAVPIYITIEFDL